MKRKGLVVAVVIIFIFAIFYLPMTRATTLCVNPYGKGGCYTTIQAAINSANPGDTINVEFGTYNLESGEKFPIKIMKDVTLIGISSTGFIPKIDATGSSNEIYGPDAAVILVSNTNVNIKGFTITGWKFGLFYEEGSTGTVSNNEITGNLAGITCLDSSPIINGNIITGNVIGESNFIGTGIENIKSSPTITNNTVTNNDFGITNEDLSNPKIDGNTINGNSSVGIYNKKSSPIVTSNMITDNRTGISNDDSSNPEIANNRITGNDVGISNDGSSSPKIINNTITGNDWGISNSNTSPIILGNTISGNTEYSIFNDNSSSIIINNIITANGGDGIATGGYKEGPIITNNTITGNSGDGIGIYNSNNPIITNNIITSNSGLGIHVIKGSSQNTYNDVWDNTLGDYEETSGGVGSISKDPMFVSLTDFHLQCSSPAIDIGNNNAPKIPSTDKDGEPRIIGEAVDMGAYETNCTALPNPKSIGTFGRIIAILFNKFLLFVFILFIMVGIVIWLDRRKVKINEIQEAIVEKRKSQEETQKDTALRKLARQYADGEITREEYERLKKILEE